MKSQISVPIGVQLEERLICKKKNKQKRNKHLRRGARLISRGSFRGLTFYSVELFHEKSTLSGLNGDNRDDEERRYLPLNARHRLELTDMTSYFILCSPP